MHHRRPLGQGEPLEEECGGGSTGERSAVGWSLVVGSALCAGGDVDAGSGEGIGRSCGTCVGVVERLIVGREQLGGTAVP